MTLSWVENAERADQVKTRNLIELALAHHRLILVFRMLLMSSFVGTAEVSAEGPGPSRWSWSTTGMTNGCSGYSKE